MDALTAACWNILWILYVITVHITGLLGWILVTCGYTKTPSVGVGTHSTNGSRQGSLKTLCLLFSQKTHCHCNETKMNMNELCLVRSGPKTYLTV